MSDLGFSEPKGGYRKAALSGGAVTGIGTLIKGSLQVFSIVLLARLLRPEDFGLMAMVFPVIAFANVFQEAGLGLAVLQRTKISNEELSTMFLLNVATGLTLALILIAVAPLVADFYGEPRVAALTVAAASLVFLAAVTTQQLALLTRSLRFRELAAIDVLSLLVGTGVAIAIAYYFRSYWAIFGLSLGTAATTCILSWSFSRWRPGRCASLRHVWDLTRFGANITVSNLAGYFTRNFDNVMIGRFSGATSLGYYERAYKIVLLPILFVQMPLSRLVLPMLNQTREQPDRYRLVFLRSYQAALLLTLPGLTLFIGASDTVILLIMGSQWTEAAPIFAWLAAAAVSQSITGPASVLFLSQDRSHEARNSSIASAFYFTTAFAIGVQWGAVGVAAAFAISSAIRVPTVFWYMTRSGPVRLGDLWTALIPFLPAALICLALADLLSPVLSRWLPPLPSLFALGIVAYLLSLPCLLINRMGREGLSDAVSTIRSLAFSR